jgi:predicted dehydrogenase
MTPLRVAVVGCGRIAVRQHLPALRASDLAELVGVCDVDLARAQAAALPYGVPAFASLDELLERTCPHVVTVATLPSSHRDLTLQALATGCHVLCEKPVALNLVESAEMVAAAERAGRLLSICFEYRYWDESTYLRERIASGHFGHIHAVRTWGGMARGFPFWRRRAQAGGGALAHWTIHNIDLALWLLGHPEPLTASAFCYQRMPHLPTGSIVHAAESILPRALESDIEDFGAAMIRLAGDTVLTVEANFLQPPSTRPEGWEFLGDRGGAGLSPLRVWLDNGRDWIDETPVPGTLAHSDYDMGRLIGDFLRRVHDGGTAPVAGKEILRIQRLMDALYASAAQGNEVAV